METAHRQRGYRCRFYFESLESRQLLSVVNVTPSGFAAAIRDSHSGDTINFAPGNYDLKAGSTLELPGNRTYVGNGAVFDGAGVSISFDRTQNVEFSGFLLDGVVIVANNVDSLYFHDNTIENSSGDGFTTTGGMTNSHVDHNTFTNLNGGIYGYPLGGNTVDNNTFDYVFEPIHFSCAQTADTMDVSGNVITHATRIGIELQGSIDNLTVNNNFMSDWLQHGTGNDDSHMGISCATGGSGQAPYTDQAQDVTISGNVLIQNGPAENVAVWAKPAIEIMGYSDLNVTGNYAWNWGNFLLNGADGPVTSTGNTIVGGDLYAPNNVPWKIAGVHASGDDRYGLKDPNAPAWRGVPGGAAEVVEPVKKNVPEHVVRPAKPKAPKTGKPKAAAKAKTSTTVVTIHSILAG